MIESKFHREPLSNKEVQTLKEFNSFKALLVQNIVFVVPIFLCFILFSFFPFLPHPTRGYGAKNPTSFLDYLKLVGRGFLVSISFAIFVIITTALIDRLRTWIDVVSRFKKVGVFQVLSVTEGDNIKILKLSGKKKIKVRRLDAFVASDFFKNVRENDVISIGQTRTNRILTIGIVS